MQQKQPMRITYLFGAGASIGNGKLLDDVSATGIPIVEKFNTDIGFFLDKIESVRLESSEDEKNRFAEMKIIFRRLYNEFSDMYSFDTFAKSLCEKGETKKLRQLKLLLKVYMMFRQELCKSDSRYDLLFATLINNRVLPSHVNFLSWNYDTQVEKSLSKFTTNGADDYTQFVHLGFKQQNRYESSLLKLNGTIAARKYFNKNYHCIAPIDKDSETQILSLIKEMIDLYSEDEQDYLYPKMYFSWEAKEKFEEVLEYSRWIVSCTDILIVVGYSFPTLNRQEDKLILNSLPSTAKIYVQCGGEVDFIEIKSKIESLAPSFKERLDEGTYLKIPSQVNYIPQSKEFFVPFEFEN